MWVNLIVYLIMCIIAYFAFAYAKNKNKQWLVGIYILPSIFLVHQLKEILGYKDKFTFVARSFLFWGGIPIMLLHFIVFYYIFKFLKK
jgi:hypothetical protein